MPVVPTIDSPWQVSPREARAHQEALAARVRIAPLRRPPRLVAGADTSYNRGSDRVAGAVVVWDTALGRVVESRTAVVETPFPYVPGLLTWREAPALLPAFAKLSVTPDLLVFNGHGIAHPRRMGLASHMGVLFDLPAAGVAQNRLAGEHDPVGERPGDWQPLRLDGAVVGAAVRTRARCRPVFVSPGHRTTLEDVLRFALENTLGYKLPAVIREAHNLCNAVRRSLTLSPTLECSA
jgi:deoxyribonuclease V